MYVCVGGLVGGCACVCVCVCVTHTGRRALLRKEPSEMFAADTVYVYMYAWVGGWVGGCLWVSTNVCVCV